MGLRTAVQALLKLGAEVNQPSEPWGNALCAAINASNDDDTIVNLLLQHGALVNTEVNSLWHDRFPLIMACRTSHKKIVKAPLAHRADTNVQQKGYLSSLLITAILHGQTHIVELLLVHEASVNQSCPTYSRAQ